MKYEVKTETTTKRFIEMSKDEYYKNHPQPFQIKSPFLGPGLFKDTNTIKVNIENNNEGKEYINIYVGNYNIHRLYDLLVEGEIDSLNRSGHFCIKFLDEEYSNSINQQNILKYTGYKKGFIYLPYANNVLSFRMDDSILHNAIKLGLIKFNIQDSMEQLIEIVNGSNTNLPLPEVFNYSDLIVSILYKSETDIIFSGGPEYV